MSDPKNLRLRSISNARDLSLGSVVVWMQDGHPDGSPLTITGKTKYGEWLGVKLKPEFGTSDEGYEYLIPNVQLAAGKYAEIIYRRENSGV